MPLRPHPDVEPATAGGAVDGGVEIKLLGRALAGEAAEATERDLDVPGAELLRIVEIPELALVPDLDGATLSPAVLADADAFRIVAIGDERRGAAGADPLPEIGRANVCTQLRNVPLVRRLHLEQKT